MKKMWLIMICYLMRELIQRLIVVELQITLQEATEKDMHIKGDE